MRCFESETTAPAGRELRNAHAKRTGIWMRLDGEASPGSRSRQKFKVQQCKGLTVRARFGSEKIMRNAFKVNLKCRRADPFRTATMESKGGANGPDETNAGGSDWVCGGVRGGARAVIIGAGGASLAALGIPPRGR